MIKQVIKLVPRYGDASVRKGPSVIRTGQKVFLKPVDAPLSTVLLSLFSQSFSSYKAHRRHHHIPASVGILLMQGNPGYRFCLYCHHEYLIRTLDDGKSLQKTRRSLGVISGAVQPFRLLDLRSRAPSCIQGRFSGIDASGVYGKGLIQSRILKDL